MNKQFVPEKIAKAMEEIGFREPCLCCYNSYGHLKGKIVGSIDGDYIELNRYDTRLLAPTWQQAFDWFRKKGYEFYIKYPDTFWKYIVYTNFSLEPLSNGGIGYRTYREAERDCLLKLIELCQEKN